MNEKQDPNEWMNEWTESNEIKRAKETEWMKRKQDRKKKINIDSMKEWTVCKDERSRKGVTI